MQLTIGERVELMNILPSQCGLEDGRVVRNLYKVLEPTEEEIKKLNIRTVKGADGLSQTLWNRKEAVLNDLGKPTGEYTDIDVPVDVEISPTGFSLILDRFAELAKDKKLNPIVHLPIYEVFLEVNAKLKI